MRKYNVHVQKGLIAQSPEEAAKVAEKLDPAGGLILKAQVHAGGRGKGIHILRNLCLISRYIEQWTSRRCKNL